MRKEVTRSLIMRGTSVYKLDELQRHFDLNAVLGCYLDDSLIKWLEKGCYNDEAKEVKTLKADPALNANPADLAKKLCSILGASCSEDEAAQVNLDDISRRSERKKLLLQITDDNEILDAEDRVAITQEELEEMLSEGVTEGYLFGDEFILPEGFEQVPYKDSVNFTVFRYRAVLADLGKKLCSILGTIYSEKVQSQVYPGDFAPQTRSVPYEPDDAEAQFKLGNVYFDEGYFEEAVKWYKKAAEQGHVKAQYNLGRCYYDGKGFNEKIYAYAVIWYKKAAEKGYQEAQYQLGRCYHYGHGDDQDYKKAVYWYTEAAKQGHKEAQYQLGLCYHYGHGVVYQSVSDARRWWKKAAEQEHEMAKYYLENQPRLY